MQMQFTATRNNLPATEQIGAWFNMVLSCSITETTYMLFVFVKLGFTSEQAQIQDNSQFVCVIQQDLIPHTHRRRSGWWMLQDSEDCKLSNEWMSRKLPTILAHSTNACQSNSTRAKSVSQIIYAMHYTVQPRTWVHTDQGDRHFKIPCTEDLWLKVNCTMRNNSKWSLVTKPIAHKSTCGLAGSGVHSLVCLGFLQKWCSSATSARPCTSLPSGDKCWCAMYVSDRHFKIWSVRFQPTPDKWVSTIQDTEIDFQHVSNVIYIQLKL